jgi:hypothetical protein
MSKKREPLNFDAPSFAEAPPPGLDEAVSLGMPPVPTDEIAAPAPEPRKRTVAARPDPAPAVRRSMAQIATKGAAAKTGSGGFIWFLAFVATLLWVGGLAAYTLGFRGRVGPFEDEPFAIAILALLGLAPVGMIWLGAFALRQGIRLLAEANNLQRMAEDMVAPAAIAAAEAGSAVDAIRLEIMGAVQAAEKARTELLQMRDLLSQETDRLVEMAGGSTTDAKMVVDVLARERAEFSVLSSKLETRTGEITDAITRHAKMVTEASDLASTQIGEAEAALAARAADLAAAAGEATETARMAGDDLSRQAMRLEAASTTVGEQVQVVEESLGQQRAALVSLAHTLRTEQEDLAVHFESQRAQLAEMLRATEQSALQLGDTAEGSAETLRSLIATVVDQLREMSDQAQTERDLLGGSALQSFGALSEAAAFERRALEEETKRAIEGLAAAAEATHKAAERASMAATAKIDGLAQAAFDAGQQADADFTRRLEDARMLIEQSAKLIDEAGERSAVRLETGVQTAYAGLEALQRSLAEIEARAAALPAEAANHGDEIRKALEGANESLLASARHAAQELEGIDAAFQERVKRNYEMLSQAVRLMGVLGGNAQARAAATPSSFTPPRPAPQPAPPVPLRSRREPPPPAPPLDDEDEEHLGLRPRLKLTPAVPEPLFEDDEDNEQIGSAPPPAPPVDDPDWSWNELVAALDENDADDSELEKTLIAQIEGLGIDATALIPRRRLDDIARLYEGGDAAGAREQIHRLAPAALRKLARRVLSDKLMRAQAERLIDRYAGLLRGASRPGGGGLTAPTLLSSDAGRAFLLLDAALGDLG